MTNHKISSPSLALYVPMLVLVGFTLRIPITSLATAIPDLRAELGISTTQAGLLTSLPILMFASASLLAGTAARKWGANRVLLAATALLGLAVLIRPWGGYGLIVATTMVVGVCIAAGNILLPVLIRRDYSHRLGNIMALNTVSITGGATIAAATTGIFISWWGWRFALSVWAAVALLAFLALWRLNSQHPGLDSNSNVQGAAPLTAAVPAPETSPHFNPRKSPAVWALGGYFALQSGMFYGSTAWFPSMLPDIANLTQEQANNGASIFQLFGVLGALTAPLAVARLHRWQVLAVGISAGYLVLFLGLLLAPSLVWLWLFIGGYCQGAIFGMLMSLLTIRSVSAGVVRSAGAIMQTIGYIGAAALPVLIGVFASSGQWNSSLVLLAVMSALLMVLAIFVGSPQRIGHTGPAVQPAQ